MFEVDIAMGHCQQSAPAGTVTHRALESTTLQICGFDKMNNGQHHILIIARHCPSANLTDTIHGYAARWWSRYPEQIWLPTPPLYRCIVKYIPDFDKRSPQSRLETCRCHSPAALPHRCRLVPLTIQIMVQTPLMSRSSHQFVPFPLNMGGAEKMMFVNAPAGAQLGLNPPCCSSEALQTFKPHACFARGRGNPSSRCLIWTWPRWPSSVKPLRKRPSARSWPA